MDEEQRKLWKTAVVLLNLLGIACLFHYGGLYLDDRLGGIYALMVGLVPLFVANALACYVLEAKKILYPIFFIPFLVCVAFVLSFLIGHSSYEESDMQILVKLMNVSDKKISYAAISEDGDVIKRKDPFDAVSDIYQADGTSYVLVNEGNRQYNRFLDPKIEGNIDDKDLVYELLKMAGETSEHMIYEADVFCFDDTYYVQVLLNVNGSDPSYFYAYDKRNEELDLLCKWQGEKVVGIGLPKEE